jgi:hypothetical protein
MAADGQEVPDTSVFLQVVDDLLEAPTYHVISEAAFGANTLTKQASAELNIAFTVVCKRSVIFKCEMAQIWQLFDCSKEVMLGKVPINIPLSRDDVLQLSALEVSWVLSHVFVFLFSISAPYALLVEIVAMIVGKAEVASSHQCASSSSHSTSSEPCRSEALPC